MGPAPAAGVHNIMHAIANGGKKRVAYRGEWWASHGIAGNGIAPHRGEWWDSNRHPPDAKRSAIASCGKCQVVCNIIISYYAIS